MLTNTKVRGTVDDTPSPPRESELVNAVIRALYPYCFITRVNTGTVKMFNGRRFSTGTPAGYSDLSGNMREGGRAVYIEVKLPDGVVSDKQREFIELRRAEGAVAGVARSVDDALRIIGIKKD